MEYKPYFVKTLTPEELKKTNRYAPIGVKYCNARCQDYRPLEEFSGTTTKKALCNICRNISAKAAKAIKNKLITIEDFKKDPYMFDPKEKNTSSVVATKYCNKCKEKKALNDFREKKAVCKGCTSLIVSANRTDIQENLEDIEKLKVNLQELEKYILNICKDKLTCIISHHSIGRKSSDTKPIMIQKIITHFRKLQDPKLCRGGCGFTLEKELSTCVDCLKKNEKIKSNSGLRTETFQESIDDIIADILEDGKPIQDCEFNKEQVFQMGRKVGLGSDKFTQLNSKAEVLKAFNDFLEQRQKEEKEKLEKLLEIVPNKTSESQIMLNGVTILARESDGFINATSLCKAGGKEFKHWNALESTKELIIALETEMVNENRSDGIPTDLFIDIIRNGPNQNRGSWIHPDLAVQLAQWLSPTFALKVSKWVREIALTGSVSVGNEKSHEQLLLLQQEFIKEKEKYKELENKEKEKYKELENKHKLILYKRSHYKFKKGPIFYIISDGTSKNQYKVGIDDVDINVRLAQHRTSLPNLKIHFLVYTKHNKELENTVLIRHQEARKLFLNHEWLFDTELVDIVDSVKTYLGFISSEYTIEEDIDKYNT